VCVGAVAVLAAAALFGSNSFCGAGAGWVCVTVCGGAWTTGCTGVVTVGVGPGSAGVVGG
jgi:hypothetical protein